MQRALAFGEGGELTITSGQEVSTHSYALTLGRGTMFLLSSTKTASNGLPDCQGHTDASAGATDVTRVMFLNNGGFFTCSSDDTMSCYGVASPVAP